LSATPAQQHPTRRHAREVDIAQNVQFFISGSDLMLVGFRSDGAAFDASVVVSRERLEACRDAINDVLDATDPA
jgi:hypothetical protein